MKLRTLLPLYLSALLGTAAAGAALLLVPPREVFTSRLVLVSPPGYSHPLPTALECRAFLLDPAIFRFARGADIRPDPGDPGGILVSVAGPDPKAVKKQLEDLVSALGTRFFFPGPPPRWLTPRPDPSPAHVIYSEDWSRPRGWAIVLGLSTWALSTALGLSLLARRRKGPSLPPESLISAPATPPGPEGPLDGLQDFPPPPPTRCAQAPGELT
jgi:hypothetical protein